MPSWDLFDSQPESYRHAVLPPEVTKRLSVEAGVTLGWERYVGAAGGASEGGAGGASIGLDRYGASAPWKDLAKHFGFTPEAVAERLEDLMAR
jgi:transketolase